MTPSSSAMEGLPGILCLGTIDYLVSRINDEPDHFKKAALVSLLTVQLADNILRMNGLRLSAHKEKICRVLK